MADPITGFEVLLTRKVLVLGGTGMVGRMVHRVLSLSEGFAVNCTHRREPSDPFYLNAEDGREGLRRIIAHQGPFDFMINCIGVLVSEIDERDHHSMRRAVAVNEKFPHDLAAAAGESRASVIHLSTDGVFSGDAGICREDSPTDCNDVYGKSKRGGEVTAPCVLNLRCSVIGPDPDKKKGLLEWFRSQPRGAEVSGYIDHEWNGVTTLQFSELCSGLILRDSFDAIRSEASVHHFCPNQAVSKYELLQLFESVYKTGVTIKPVAGTRGPSSRLLDTRYASLKEFYGYGRSMRRAVEELATWETKNRDLERF